MILIADSGSTKTDWALLGGDNSSDLKEIMRFSSIGCNPSYMTDEELLEAIISSMPSEIDMSVISEVDFYGAGVNEMTGIKLRAVLEQVFPAADKVAVESDMLGCARALLGHSEGFAAILGTGMNTCLYDGDKIVLNVPSLGFFLGDEGSAGYIGKTLLRDYLRGRVSSKIASDLCGLTGGKSVSGIISELYSSPRPNVYCAGFCSYVTANMDKDEYCRGLVASSFHDFFRSVICLYPSYSGRVLGCAGSVAFVCRDILSEVASSYGITLGTVLRSPIDGLVRYHLYFGRN